MPLTTPFQLANDSEMRLLLGYSGPPRAGKITADNYGTSGTYTVGIADGDNATVEAWPLNGFQYAVGNVVYILQAENAPDSGVIIGRKGHATKLGVGVSTPASVLHVEDTVGGFAVLTAAKVGATEITLLSGRVWWALTARVLLIHRATNDFAVDDVTLYVPTSGTNWQDVVVGADTIRFRLYYTGDLRLVWSAGAGAGTVDVILRAMWI